MPLKSCTYSFLLQDLTLYWLVACVGGMACCLTAPGKEVWPWCLSILNHIVDIVEANIIHAGFCYNFTCLIITKNVFMSAPVFSQLTFDSFDLFSKISFIVKLENKLTPCLNWVLSRTERNDWYWERVKQIYIYIYIFNTKRLSVD